MVGSGGEKRLIPVSIRMSDGSVVQGEIAGGLTTDLGSALNKVDDFIEFVSRDGQRKFLAKNQIAYLEPVEPLRKPTLTPRLPGSDPFAMLGLPQTCDFDTAKAKFRELAKMYHPDTVNAIDLPEDVKRYMTEMFRQVNNAFTQLRGDFESRQPATGTHG